MKTIAKWLEEKTKWLKKTTTKDLTLTAFLQDALRKSVETDEDVYAGALKARSDIEVYEAFVKVKEAREKTVVSDEEEDNEPRKKGYLELSFEAALDKFLASSDATDRNNLLSITTQMEVNRRVRFLYDLQKLRIGANNRRDINKRNFGIEDIYLDYSGEVLQRLETYNIKMIDRVIGQSPDGAFYQWLKDTYLGVGPQMAACIISELSAPERFRNVSALWAYCGLHVVGNSDEGFGGYAARREAGATANWNSFIKTKLLGVLADIMVKHQTKYIGTEEEYTKGRNISCLNGYKSRIHHRNENYPEALRAYKKDGKEIFHNKSSKPVVVFNKDGKAWDLPKRPCDLQRRTKAHINDMAKRYMIKMFLCEILNKWREFKGLEPFLTYDEAKLRGGVRHGENPNLRQHAQ